MSQINSIITLVAVHTWKPSITRTLLGVLMILQRCFSTVCRGFKAISSVATPTLLRHTYAANSFMHASMGCCGVRTRVPMRCRNGSIRPLSLPQTGWTRLRLSCFRHQNVSTGNWACRSQTALELWEEHTHLSKSKKTKLVKGRSLFRLQCLKNLHLKVPKGTCVLHALRLLWFSNSLLIASKDHTEHQAWNAQAKSQIAGTSAVAGPSRARTHSRSLPWTLLWPKSCALDVSATGRHQSLQQPWDHRAGKICRLLLPRIRSKPPANTCLTWLMISNRCSCLFMLNLNKFTNQSTPCNCPHCFVIQVPSFWRLNSQMFCNTFMQRPFDL